MTTTRRRTEPASGTKCTSSDLAQGHVQALAHLDKHGGTISLNLGTGRGLSIREVLDGIKRTIGREVPTVMKPRREGDPPALYADPSKARELLGFAPQHSDIDTIIRTAWPFFCSEASNQELAPTRS